MKKALHILIILTLVFTMAGGFASDASAAKETDLSAAVVLLAPTRSVYTGASQIPKVTVMCGAAALTEKTDYTVTAGTMKDAGSYTIRIAGTGSYTGQTSATFVIDPVNLSGASISLSRDLTTDDLNADRTAVKDSVLQSVVSVKQGSSDVTAFCKLSSAVNGSVVTIKAATAAADGKNIAESAVSKDFALKFSMQDCRIEEIPAQIYSGAALKPTVTVKNKNTGEVLAQGTDYSVTYENNINAGTTAKVTVTGKGDYAGTLTAYFTIDPKDIFLCTAFYTNGRSSSAYTGSSVYPAVTVRDGYNILTADQDYILTYWTVSGEFVLSMKNAGEYKVAITGTGNYTGKITLDYEIIGTDISEYRVTLRESRVKADGQPKVPAVTSVKHENSAVLTSADYDVSYLDASGEAVTELKTPGKYTVVVTGKNGYCGSTYADFEIVGSQQEILLDKTAYKVYKLSKDFRLEPEATGDGTGFTYVSSDPEVASVSADGVVSIHKIGRAKITVTTTGMTLSAPAEEEVFVKVYPYRTVLTQKPFTEGAKKSFRVRWNTQEDVTYYQVCYSTTSTFKAGTCKTKKVLPLSKNYATQSTSITGLKSGKRYYVKVRAVKVVYSDSGKALYYYGNWSGWRSVVTK